MLGALHYVRTNAATVQSIVDADSVNSTIVSKVDAAVATAGVNPNYANLVAQAKEMTSVATANFATILSSGVYIQSCFLNPNCSLGMYGKLTGQSSQLAIAYYSESSNAWVPFTPNNTSRRLGSSGWEVSQFSSTFSYTAIDTVIAQMSSPWGGVTSIGTLGEFDLSNKTSVDIPGAWAKNSTYLKSITFPSGSKVYITRGAPTADQYILYSEYPYTSGPSGSRALNSTYSSIADLIADHQTTGATNTSKHLSWGDITVTFDSYDASGTATLWNDTNYPCVRVVDGYSCGGGSPSFTKIGSVPYETRTVDGINILVIFAQSSVNDSGYQIYSTRSGSVYRGVLTPKGHPYNPSLYFNRTAYDAILASWSKPTVLN